MMGTVVRLYLEVNESVPTQHRPKIVTPIIDCTPEEAKLLKSALQRRGYSVLAVPL